MPALHTKEYQPLQDASFEKEDYFDHGYVHPTHERFFSLSIKVAFVLSVLLNAVWLYQSLSNKAVDVCKSQFAGLTSEIPIAFAIEGRENTIPDEEWEYPDPDTGTVVFSDDYAASKNLPPAQRYPWDLSKGIYFLQGYHNLHCLYMVRNSILEYRNNTLQSEHWLHVDHCLTALRDDILCNADDTPRYTGGHHKQPNSGTDQTRLCRDWSKLENWAKARSGCYRTPSNPWDGKSTLERYMYCPDGSEPWKGSELYKELLQAKGGK